MVFQLNAKKRPMFEMLETKFIYATLVTNLYI